jgi:hypothetical protein
LLSRTKNSKISCIEGGFIMKRYILFLIISGLLLNATSVNGIIIEDGFFGALTLENDDTLLMTGGGGYVKFRRL